MPYPKPCKRCGESYTPTSFANKICKNCILKARKEGYEKRMEVLRK